MRFLSFVVVHAATMLMIDCNWRQHRHYLEGNMTGKLRRRNWKRTKRPFQEKSSSPNRKNKDADREGCTWALGAVASQGAHRWRFRFQFSWVRGSGSSRYHFELDHLGRVFYGIPCGYKGCASWERSSQVSASPPRLVWCYIYTFQVSLAPRLVPLSAFLARVVRWLQALSPFALRSTAPSPWKAIPEHCCLDEEN